MRKSLAMLSAAALGILCYAADARAAVKWSYGADSTAVYNTNNSLKTSKIDFIGASNNVEGESGIIVYRLLSSYDVTQPDLDGPDSFDGVNSKYTLTVNLTDTQSQQKGTITFSGRFAGNNMTVNSFSAAKQAFIWDSPLQQTLVLGDANNGSRTYTLEITSATPPGAPGDPGGAIYADVTIKDGNDNGGSGGEDPNPPGPGVAPEPATMAMAAFGIPALFVLRRRRKS